MTKRHPTPGVIAGLILAGAALSGLTLLLVRRQSEQGEKPAALEDADAWRDSWLPDDVLDLPTDSSALAGDGAGEADKRSDEELAEIFDRPRS